MKPYNEGLPMIDKLIEQWNGEWKYESEDSIKCVSSWDSLSPLEYFELTREEFEKRAKELGYINGYEYGVEYPTNGKKPDLPDDVRVEYKNLLHGNKWVRISTVGKLYFGTNCTNTTYPITAFRIVDERYKPKEQDMNDWYEKGELPPVGVECQFTVDVSKLPSDAKAYIEFANNEPYRPVTCKVTHYGKSHFLYESQGQEYSMITAHVNFRPLRNETDKLVEQIFQIIYDKDDYTHAAEELAKQGYRKIKPMSEDEFVDKVESLYGVRDLLVKELYRAGCRFLDQGETK